MNKKDVCLNNKSIAYFSGFGGLEFKEIEYGVDDYMYCISGAWTGKPSYHKLKIYYSKDSAYIKLYGVKISFDDCIRMGV